MGRLSPRSFSTALVHSLEALQAAPLAPTACPIWLRQTAGKPLLLGSRWGRELGWVVYSRHASLGASRRPGSLCASFPLSSLAHHRGGGAGDRRSACASLPLSPAATTGNMALNGAEVDDFSWEPPTEAETKVLQARRERQNRISSLMGDYLLRGYRMLGDTCADCGTILLQNKQRQTYCVACQELDSDVDKDNPALNAQAALSQAREHQLASALEPPSGARPAPQPPVPRPEHCEGAAAGLKAAQGPAPPAVPPNADVMASTREALLQKLTWASAELGSSASLETSIQLCSLIRACAEALQSLQQLQH